MHLLCTLPWMHAQPRKALIPSGLMDWVVQSQVWIQVSATSSSLGLHICKMGLYATYRVSIPGTDESHVCKPPACVWLRTGTHDMGLSLWGPRRGGRPKSGGRGRLRSWIWVNSSRHVGAHSTGHPGGTERLAVHGQFLLPAAAQACTGISGSPHSGACCHLWRPQLPYLPPPHQL